MKQLSKRVDIALEFKPQDAWIGAYWEWKCLDRTIIRQGYVRQLNIWICLVPCFPLHIAIERKP